MPWLEKSLQDAMLVVFGGYLLIPLIFYFVCSVLIANWAYRKAKTIFYRSIPVSFALGIIVFAAFLVIHGQLDAQSAKVEHDRIAAETQKKLNTKEMERSSPKYLERKIKDWTDRSGYSSRSVDPENGESFRILATGSRGQLFTIVQRIKMPGIVSSGILISPGKPLADKLSHLSEHERQLLFMGIATELLRLGVQYVITGGAIIFFQEVSVDADGSGVEFINKLYDIWRAKELVEIRTNEAFEKPRLK